MDVIAQAQSGTGKTATFSISILQQIDTNLRECQVLILSNLSAPYWYKGIFSVCSVADPGAF
jgi:hypothetical protein